MTKAPNSRHSTYGFLGLTSNVTKEVFEGASRLSDNKTYTYDAYDTRISMVDDPKDAAPKTYTYGYDAHGSVSTLLDDSDGTVKASYGYDAYGGRDATLSSGDDVNGRELDPLNPYRYTARRLDTGSGTLDMGARRFGPDSQTFLQPDYYQGALANLGLSMDPLSGNRYSLAAGNPVSFVEVDGHKLADIGYQKKFGTGRSGQLADVGDEGRPQPEPEPEPEENEGFLADTAVGRGAMAAERFVESIPPFSWVEDFGDRAEEAEETEGLGDVIAIGVEGASWLVGGAAIKAGGRLVRGGLAAIAGGVAKRAAPNVVRSLVSRAVDRALGRTITNVLPKSLGRSRALTRLGDNAIELSEHALVRMTQRQIGLTEVAAALRTTPFKYWHGGVWKTGYYHAGSNTFVGVYGGVAKTVIRPSAGPRYVQNLLRAKR